MLTKFQSFLLRAGLLEAVFLTCFFIILTLTVTFVTDSVYKVSIGKSVFKTGNLTMVNSNGSSSNSTNSTSNSSTTENTQKAPANNPANSITPTPPASSGTTQPPSSSPPSSSPPPATPPPATPPPAPSGCFVTVNGYLYNMQSAVGNSLTDPNTGKKRTHSSGTFQCGSFASPTNMTSTYMSKHSSMGCATRLAPYIYTPPAPADPSC